MARRPTTRSSRPTAAPARPGPAAAAMPDQATRDPADLTPPSSPAAKRGRKPPAKAAPGPSPTPPPAKARPAARRKTAATSAAGTVSRAPPPKRPEKAVADPVAAPEPARLAPVPRPAAGKVPAAIAAEPSEERQELAGRNVEQAREAYRRYVSVTERMLGAFEGLAREASSGVRDANLRMLGFADANARAAFDHAERLFQARDLAEVMRLQRAYLQEATERLARQVREVRDTGSKAASDALEALRPKS